MTEWRLPTKNELQSLAMENQQFDRKAYQKIFLDIGTKGWFWSSSELFNAVSFDFGKDHISTSHHKGSGRVRLVRQCPVCWKANNSFWHKLKRTTKKFFIFIWIIYDDDRPDFVGSWKKGDPFEKRFVISECTTFVTDNKTCLQWKRVAEPGKVTWRTAIRQYKLP